jgi:hypothetical protein
MSKIRTESLVRFTPGVDLITLTLNQLTHSFCKLDHLDH